ncbi:MAG: hypothetical protein ACXV7J_12905 [Methylomonas sp.]
MYRAKDFIETPQGLIFAIVADGLEAGKVRCFLRYINQDGRWRKVATEEANRHLAEHHAEYLFYSRLLDARLHGVAEDSIVRHYSPRQVLQQLLKSEASDSVLGDLQHLCDLFQRDGIALEQVGITGSLLIGAQNHASDIDLVCYDRAVFHQLRNRVQSLIARDKCRTLNDSDWLDAYRRRACDLPLDEYIWHEQRKYNKAIVNQRKFDLSLIAEPRQANGKIFKKLGQVRIEAQVVEDHYGFDYPAEFALDHAEIDSVVSFTATYTGQAQAGERVVIAGQLEADEQGVKRVVVGSNREAIGEYIKLVR